MENRTDWGLRIHDAICRDYRHIVYFLHAPAVGKVKIGTTYRAQKRLEEIQMCCPVPLIYLGAIRGDEKVEADWHRRAAPWHSHGEWFDLSPELAQMIFIATSSDTWNQMTTTQRKAVYALVSREGFPDITDDDLRGMIRVERTD